MPYMWEIPEHVCTVCMSLFLCYILLSVLAWPVCTVTHLQTRRPESTMTCRHSTLLSWYSLLSVLILRICFHDVFAELCHAFHPLFPGTKQTSLWRFGAFLRRTPSLSSPFVSPLSLSKEFHLFRCSLLSFLSLSLPQLAHCLASVLPLKGFWIRGILSSPGPAGSSSAGQKVRVT